MCAVFESQLYRTCYNKLNVSIYIYLDDCNLMFQGNAGELVLPDVLWHWQTAGV